MKDNTKPKDTHIQTSSQSSLYLTCSHDSLFYIFWIRVEKKKINHDFLIAAKYGDLETCTELLSKKRGELKAEVDYKEENDWCPLHFACLNGNTALVELLIRNEANIEAETNLLKFTPLIIASQKGHRDIASLLMQAGADINGVDMYNNTPLHYASQSGMLST